MRFGTSLFAALVLAGALGNAARAQVPDVLTYRQQVSGYTGPYSVYGPGLTYRQDSNYTGPYSGRLGSASSPAQTRTNSDPSLRTAGSTNQAGNGRGRGDDANRPDAGRAGATGGEPGVPRRRYVRISIAGNAIQAVVVP
jgi:hypothetical protein